MRTKVVALEHILEALTLYLRSLSILNDDEYVTKVTSVQKDTYVAVEIERLK